MSSNVAGRVDRSTVRTWALWRVVLVCFCVFSLVGHWMEIPYCAFNDVMFGIVDPETAVFDDPFFPYLVYGIGTVLFVLIFVPLKQWICLHMQNSIGAMVIFLFLAIVMCMVMELSMGFIMNQPDAAGVYPLWDNSTLPGNILGQAWIVNDVGLGIVATVYVWVIWPYFAAFFARIPNGLANGITFFVVCAFTVLCVVKFSSVS